MPRKDASVHPESFTLWVARATDTLPAGTIRQGVLDEGLLNQTESLVLCDEIFKLVGRDRVVTVNNPFLDSTSHAFLDEHGVIKVGTSVTVDTVLVSIIQQDHAAPGMPVPTPSNHSLTVPAPWYHAVVTGAIYEKRPSGKSDWKTRIARKSCCQDKSERTLWHH